MRAAELERAEREVQFRQATKAALAVEIVRLLHRLDAVTAEYREAEDIYQTAEAKAAALRPALQEAPRLRLNVVP